MAPSEEEFDYIIVGAGSAGCVMANRLSEDPDVSVCLIEAGKKDKSLLIRMPAGVGGLIKDENPQNWGFWTTPQKHMEDREERKHWQQQGQQARHQQPRSFRAIHGDWRILEHKRIERRNQKQNVRSTIITSLDSKRSHGYAAGAMQKNNDIH